VADGLDWHHSITFSLVARRIHVWNAALAMIDSANKEWIASSLRSSR
jgi:hypothetical protein